MSLEQDMFDALVRHVYSLPPEQLVSEARRGLPEVILAMPEMQAIREYLRADLEAFQNFDDGLDFFRKSLPESVIEWVLDGGLPE